MTPLAIGAHRAPAQTAVAGPARPAGAGRVAGDAEALRWSGVFLPPGERPAVRPGRVPAINGEPQLAEEGAPHAGSRPPARAGEIPPTAPARGLAAPGRPLVRSALGASPLPEVTVDVDGVIVDLEPSR